MRPLRAAQCSPRARSGRAHPEDKGFEALMFAFAPAAVLITAAIRAWCLLRSELSMKCSRTVVLLVFGVLGALGAGCSEAPPPAPDRPAAVAERPPLDVRESTIPAMQEAMAATTMVT